MAETDAQVRHAIGHNLLKQPLAESLRPFFVIADHRVRTDHDDANVVCRFGWVGSCMNIPDVGIWGIAQVSDHPVFEVAVLGGELGERAPWFDDEDPAVR